MARDESNKFSRPIPQRQHEILRKNLKAPQHNVESLSEKTKRSGIGNIETNEFPIEGLAPSIRQPQKNINRGKITQRDDNIKDITQVVEALEYSLKEHETFIDNGLINDINRLINID